MTNTRKSSTSSRHFGAALISLVVALAFVPARAQDAPAAPQVEEWGDEFDGDTLDEAKWEPYTFEEGAAKISVAEKQLRLRGAGASRGGVRSKPTFHSDRFYVEASLAKVADRLPEAGESANPPGFAIVTVLFNGNPANRIEWLLRSDGRFEAWQATDGRMARLDNGKLATKEKTPRLGIARKGDQVFFMLNREVGLEKTLRGLSSDFKVMVYGFGNTENSWDSVYVQTLKQ